MKKTIFEEIGGTEQHTGVCEGDCGERDYLPIRKV